MSELSLSKIHDSVIKLMPAINQSLAIGFSKTNKVSYKTSPHFSISVVTKLDSQTENVLKKSLKKILPETGFIGEETGINVQPEYNWVIDPIDGTLNFANKIPVFAVSIALWRYNEPVYALTSFPLQNEIIHAFKGGGIFLNNKKISLKLPKEPTTITFYQVVGDAQLKKSVFKAVLQQSSRPRNFGSCVFHGSYAALGRADGAVFINQALWDIGAIVLQCQEAGLTINYLSAPPNLQTDKLENYQYSLVVAPQKLAQKLYDHLLF